MSDSAGDDAEKKKELGVGKILDLVSTFETAIRYLLTGAIVSAIALAGAAKQEPVWEFIEKSPGAAGVVVIAVGFASYTLYRLCSWALIDGVVWTLGWSVPSEFESKKCSYALPYAEFLMWRYSSDKYPKEVGSYLAYRWAAAHFSVVFALAFGAGLWLAQDGSPLRSVPCLIGWPVVVLFLVIGFWQKAFLFRVERSLYELSKVPET